MAVIHTHKELRVYQQARELSQKVYHLTRKFPDHEIYNLTSQILRSSRSVRGNIAEAWQRRRYKASFVAKLNDAETEACETGEWATTAFDCGYISKEEAEALERSYQRLVSQLVAMADQPEKWVVKREK